MLLHKLTVIMITLVTRPLSLSLSAFLFVLRTLMIVVNTWVEVSVAAINAHVALFRKTIIGVIALLSLPIRVLTALQRERQLEDLICEMQIELDDVKLDMKELEDKFYTTFNERRVLEMMLTEVEDESDRVIAKIELLEKELRHFKRENLQLKGVLGKGHDYGLPCDIQSWKSSYKGNEIVFEDLAVHKEAGEDDAKSKEELLNIFQAGREVNASIHSSNLEMKQMLKRRREAALSQSLFSALLSLLVGLIIWSADDNCLPLVVALFIVVGMSLKSVVEFFSTIENKPASDAIALLSFNCFILGTIGCPTLPIIARLLAPLITSCLDKTMSWLGIYSSTSS